MGNYTYLDTSKVNIQDIYDEDLLWIAYFENIVRINQVFSYESCELAEILISHEKLIFDKILRYS